MESPKIIPQKNEVKNSPTAGKRKISKKNNDGARRFSDEQIQSLESIFKTESKLEPRRKVELARDLGLQPRQVAIWFQNKRARWKSKQIEQEYKDLRASYDSLCVRFDGLKREKQSLLMQLGELKKNELVKSLDRVNPDNGSNEGMDRDDVIRPDDENHEKIAARNLDKTEDDEVPSWNEEDEIMSHLASPEKWRDFSPGGLFDQPPGTSGWWEN